MNEIELLRRIGAEVPEHDDLARSRAFRRLQVAIPISVREIDPPKSYLRRRRWPVVTVVAAAILLALVWPILDVNRPGARVSAASEVLEEMARAAEIRPYQEPQRGAFVYTKSRALRLAYGGNEATGEEWVSAVPVTREIWLAPEGSGRIREVWGDPKFLTERDREVWVAAGKPDLQVGPFVTDEAFSEGELRYIDLSNLPVNPEELHALIDGRVIVGGPPGDAETFTLIGDMLRETSAPPDVRAALFRVAANLQGVELIGETTDESGRPGTAVGYTEEGITHELIFDPVTSVLLGERTADSQGTIRSWAVYVTSAAVGSTGQRP